MVHQTPTERHVILPARFSLYYLRSKSVQRAGFAGGVEADNTSEAPKFELGETTDYDECLACQ